MNCRPLQLIAVALLPLVPTAATPHGFAGKRFFPATLATEDPFVSDELSLPTIAYRRFRGTDEEPGSRETTFSADMAKRITERFGISVGATYTRIRPDGGERVSGFDNLEVGVKYQLYTSAEREAIVSIGADWDVGGSGSRRIGAESFSTITPSVFFGKGFGDLPEDMRFLRPLAVTGALGVGFPTRASTATFNDDGDAEVERHPHTLKWGFALQYSLPYLQSFVKDVGLRAPFDRMIPVIEVALETPLDRGRGGTTGTINPGVLWAGSNAQVGVEAVIPVNERSGKGVGWMAQLHFFLDDLLPTSLGRPLVRK